jgi:hypothetical protein
MTRLDFEDLISQAEREGVTLAEVISRQMSPGEMDKAQGKLERQLSENYRRIEDFMSGIEVPSIEEMMMIEESDDFELGLLEEPELSDEQVE